MVHNSKALTKVIPLTAGILIFLLGGTVFFGWLIHNPFLTKLSTSFEPMMPNTALNFLLLGAGLISFFLHRIWIQILLAQITLFISLLTLTEYLFNLNFGIDHLFFNTSLFSGIFPGRMAFLSALAFLFSGISLLFLKTRYNFLYNLIVELSSCLIISISFLPLWNFLTGLEVGLNWFNFTQMVPHTSFGFLLYGFCVFIYVACLNPRTSIALSFSLTVGLMIITIGLWKGFHEELHQKELLISAFSTSHLLLFIGLFFALIIGCMTFFIQVYRERKRKLEKVFFELKKSKQRAEQANNAKTAFLAMMSHELRTPLNVVIGTSNLLKETSLTSIQNRYIERIIVSGETLLRLITDILDFSTIQSGGLILTKEIMNLKEVVRKVISSFQKECEEKKLRLIFNLPAHDLWTISDPFRISQLLNHLIRNAIKFTEKGTVTVSMFYKLQTKSGTFVRFEVKDTGIGIPKEKFPLLFNTFSQVDSSRTRKFGGAGLGLAACQQLVELFKGKMGFKSEIGKGSLFWFEIFFSDEESESE